ncbi:peptide-n4-(n-acetyl-beta-glucosaminyl)asparagine amidase a [Diplodia corticola]|uniref:Peptide-n4-(N-acetyl-beta-glucosaminyl)asparagine amidase a n=1 Tax=Diplodia corticola TaxID=236234 RepID=A0A1J9S342_9PEZI|nr:peptide-n4-(n-acetyl-beta-glucosaminyl)asparagine amidase a [Diplodia corticola]OJD34975.1 peptide-n4-(n-acetyl-beta-glucosaminyl)asparagine amidase a [Diplodia corticola]
MASSSSSSASPSSSSSSRAASVLSPGPPSHLPGPMGNGEIANGTAAMTLQKALDIAREAESGVDPNVANFLQRELDGVWSKLRAQPDSYIFTRDEYSLFNYYHQQQTGNELATKAIQRFWNHYRIADPAARG